MNCEKCSKEHNGSYGSGRFCCKECACSYSSLNKRTEINQKVSLTLLKRTADKRGITLEALLKEKEDRKERIAKIKLERQFLLDNPEIKKQRYNEYMRQYMAEVYDKRKEVVTKILGDTCVNCGSNDNLQIDHKDWRLKEYSLSSDYNMPLNEFIKELSKCQILCADCHKEKSRQDWKEQIKEKGINMKEIGRKGGLANKGKSKPKTEEHKKRISQSLKNRNASQI